MIKVSLWSSKLVLSRRSDLMSDPRDPVFVPDRLSITVNIVLPCAAAICWLVSYYLMPLMLLGQIVRNDDFEWRRRNSAIASIASVGFLR